MTKHCTLLLLLCGFLGRMWAQQGPQYSLYMLSPHALNPAYAGLEGTLVATGFYRQQWSGLRGAPLSQQVDAHLPIFAISSGAGIRLQNEAVGAHTTTSAVVNYNYQTEISRGIVLSFGVGVGYMQYGLDGTKLRAPEGTYAEPTGGFTHNDDLLPESKIQAGTPILETGIFLKTAKFTFGIGMQPIFAPVLKATNNGNFSLQPKRHYNLLAAYDISATDNLLLQPSVLVKSDITETQTDISLKAVWRENTFAGVSYRGLGATSRDAVVLFAGFRLNEKSNLAYAYDIPLSPLNAANRGSHELCLRYSLNRPIGAGKLPPIIYNPRFQ